MAVCPEIDDHTSGSEFPLAHPKPVVILIDGPVEENVALVGIAAGVGQGKILDVAGAWGVSRNAIGRGHASDSRNAEVSFSRNTLDVSGRIDQFHRDLVTLRGVRVGLRDG